MKGELTDAQRNLLFKLVIGGEPLGTDVAKSKLRKPLIEKGLAEDVPKNPPKKRPIVCAATETGWAWVAEHIAEPFTTAVQLRDAWNPLVRKLAAYLEARGDNLANVLNTDPAEAPPPEPHREPPQSSDLRPPAAENAPPRPAPLDRAGLLHTAYLELSGGRPQRRVLIADLRRAVGHRLDRAAFDEELAALVHQRRVSVFPEDDRAALRPEDRESAFVQSGVPMHVIYWEV